MQLSKPNRCRGALRSTVATLTAVVALVLAPSQITAQGISLPARWSIRPDAGGRPSEVTIVIRRPGFQVATGPATILFDSAMQARGNWRLESTLHLFDPGARAEGFGLFFGGRDLNGVAPHYAYALVRRDGTALLKVRDGATTRTVREWAANGAIPVWKPGVPGSSVAYRLVVEAIGDRVTLWVGATKVLDAARSEMPTEGIVGVRVNHGLTLYIENIAVAPVTTR